MKIKRIGGRTPVVMAEKSKSRRRLARGRDGIHDPEVLTAPLPGPMLVLLSRLHRSEITPEIAWMDDDERWA
ncbi:hypothetical protein PMNALOAF_4285 [Methylobacterium adhaesivum]|jgi:hypothetical protein|nr:hypothetical protein PMNALOAF_4285 [Methylobacterium adhaesivum]